MACTMAGAPTVRADAEDALPASARAYTPTPHQNGKSQSCMGIRFYAQSKLAIQSLKQAVMNPCTNACMQRAENVEPALDNESCTAGDREGREWTGAKRTCKDRSEPEDGERHEESPVCWGRRWDGACLAVQPHVLFFRGNACWQWPHKAEKSWHPLWQLVRLFNNTFRQQ
jgi:hypothetical protein